MTAWTVIAFFLLGICYGIIAEREKNFRRHKKWLAELEKQYILDDDIKTEGPTSAEEEAREARIRDREIDAARADYLRDREDRAQDVAGFPEDK